MKKLDESQKNQFMFTLQIAMHRAYMKGRKSKEEGKSANDSLKEFEEWRDVYIKDIADASGLV